MSRFISVVLLCFVVNIRGLAIQESKISLEVFKAANVLVVGGSGRVGGSCSTHLTKLGAKVTVGGTNKNKFLEARERWKVMFPRSSSSLQNIDFVELDREKPESVASALKKGDYNLIIHTAGPFQGKVKATNGVLEAAVNAGIAYCDVCDDFCTASAAKTKYDTRAKQTNTPCIVSTGCWPGVSSLMAKQLVTKLIQETRLQPKDLSVNFSFFTAGSGGAGATLLVATFLILAEKALIIKDGRRREIEPMRDYSRIDFGPSVGQKDVAHLNLLETASITQTLGVSNVQSLFGTAPNFWNALLGAMARLPSSLLSNEDVVQKLSIFSMPIVRIVDYFAGATNAMRCDVTSPDGRRVTAIYAHENLEPCVGECVVAFAAAILSGAVKPGVLFPEEAIASGVDSAAVLGLASVGAHTNLVESDGLNLKVEEVWGLSQRTSRTAVKIS